MLFKLKEQTFESALPRTIASLCAGTAFTGGAAFGGMMGVISAASGPRAKGVSATTALALCAGTMAVPFGVAGGNLVGRGVLAFFPEVRLKTSTFLAQPSLSGRLPFFLTGALVPPLAMGALLAR